MESLNFIEEAVLLGLAGADAKGCTVSDLRKLLGKKGTDSTASFGVALERLQSLGMVEKLPRVGRSKTGRWRLLPNGEASLALPSARKRGWKVPVLRALAARHALKLMPDIATGLVKGGQLSAWFLADRLGLPFTPTTTLESLAGLVTAQALGVSNAEPATLWSALMRRAIGSEEQAVAAPVRVESFDLVSFAGEVLHAARAVPADGWFGSQKVFIHRVHAAWQAETHRSPELALFKRHLLSAMRSGHLALTRADFTATLAPEDLQQSEIKDGAETFHFIATERSSTL